MRRPALIPRSGRSDTGPVENKESSASPRDVDAALAEIERTLDQMLVLAEVSASSLDVDRAALQKTLERLQRKIDRIADHLQAL